MLNIIAFLVFAGSLATIIILLYRKLPFLEELNIDKSHQEKKKKYNLIEQRLKRKLGNIKKNEYINKATKKFAAFKAQWEKLHSNVKIKRHVYTTEITPAKKQEEPFSYPTASPIHEENHLSKAIELYNQNKLDEAEDLLIHIVKENPKFIDAYKLLAKVYLAKKHLIHGEATQEHVVKLADRLKQLKAIDYLELAEIKLRLEKFLEALHSAKKALSLEPLSPKILHFLVQICIVCKQKELAWKYYKKLKSIDKDNQSLDNLLEDLKKIEK